MPLAGARCLLLALLSLYALVQCAVNYRALRESCDAASVAVLFNLVNGLAGAVGLVYVGWRASQGIGAGSAAS
jgi:hypothetical protein